MLLLLLQMCDIVLQTLAMLRSRKPVQIHRHLLSSRRNDFSGREAERVIRLALHAYQRSGNRTCVLETMRFLIQDEPKIRELGLHFDELVIAHVKLTQTGHAEHLGGNYFNSIVSEVNAPAEVCGGC